ncbi:5,6-dimethylbenzimidazole synthase [Rhodobacteraceae bacterium THAF1]|uniref:5,6-dimethylbenzimidazole synthase n=1 Tax=Palleronia sp. THAF1 TaxID=2587842 RepID=UPI000F403B92|nr:5,6-dimethylbenzimidazole synthase [Palleronia sp. THAF1]QFU10060.1 5,6-dimethylbenzimidazole synthase [Palleronia sp. THAF1]VDC17035.1 5,6-dimethylbenzimidazole synthase [Rhodobacteraceae bacterium THAF1]
MDLTVTHRTALADILRWRRDVRHFSPEPLDQALMDRLRRSVECAPSVGNARPWRVLQVEDRAKRAQVVEIFETCNADAAGAYDAETRREYVALKLAGLKEAPVHLAVFTDHGVTEGRGLGRQTMAEMLDYSTVMAIHTLWLAARAENVGLGWVSILDPVAVARVLDVPSDWFLTGYLCLGRAVEATETPVLHENGWQENTATDWRIV